MPSPFSASDRQFAANWLTDAWSVWLLHGVDWSRGAFFESLRPDDLSSPARFRRLRVASRQVYVFAQAAAAGIPLAGEAVSLGLDFLRLHARQPDGGYARRFDLDNAPTDRTRDLYDHAFVLLALAHTARAAEARQLLAYLGQNFRHADGGFREAVPDALPRRQNPHMHLLEALLAAHAAFGEAKFLDLADEIVDLLLDRMMQRPEGALAEFFDSTLMPVSDADGCFLVEPGHHFEWVWLLGAYLGAAGAAGRPARAAELEATIGQLMRHAERHGIDPDSGLVFDAITQNGAVRGREFRLWPQTERLRAAIARPDLARTDAARCLTLLRRYLDDAPVGLWQEFIAPAEPQAAVPASSLYHLTGALLDVVRS